MNCCTRWDRQDDPQLYDLYTEKLLEPGWDGELNPKELAYVKLQLQQSASLRRRWGFRSSAKRLSEACIRAVAMYGLLANKRGVSASPVGGQRAYSVENIEKRQKPRVIDTKNSPFDASQGQKMVTLW